MTIEQFDRFEWRAGLKVKHAEDGRVCPVSGVDFYEKAVGLRDFMEGAEPGDIHWSRCENVEIVE
ncbi:MAG: hypothetical protein EBY40_01065 [Marivivens sp.]|nr:hypothetical protein [Marivivens sp.]NBT49985.1 hypothetical protein [Marivivens sp.]NCW67368.1 hypothetical protein [Marivivens sp.]NDH01698.1 hypothetical protein [Marivivens sp.]